jgi:class 3 adenylate cyclase
LNKELGTIMLVTESVYRKAGLNVGVTDRGLVQVKGRQEPVRIYEVAPPEPDEGER